MIRINFVHKKKEEKIIFLKENWIKVELERRIGCEHACKVLLYGKIENHKEQTEQEIREESMA